MRHLMSPLDLTVEELDEILDLANDIEANWFHKYQTGTVYHTDFGCKNRGPHTSQSARPVKMSLV